jgi:salicylate hydroxylase
LHEYGLSSKFLDKVVWPKHFAFRRYASGEVIGTTPLQPHLVERYGYPYWLIHRADFQRILYDAALSLGAVVLLDSVIDSVDPWTPGVALTNGQVLTADLVIGADGIRSKTRAAVLGDLDVQPKAASNCSYRATVPKHLMESDPLTAHLMTDINANAWIGPDHHIMAYPIGRGAMYNLVMSHPDGSAEAGTWNSSGVLQEMRDHYADFDSVIQRVLSKVTSCLNWKIADLPPLPTWVSKSGKVVLLGDACHAMVPFLAQGAAQALEDGACLGECLGRITSPEQLPMLLHVYESIRKPRTERVQSGTRDTAVVWHLPDGPEQEARDLAFKSMALVEKSESVNVELERANPNSLSSKEFQPWLFGYNAFDVANRELDRVVIKSDEKVISSKL